MSEKQPANVAQATPAKEKVYKLTIAAKRNPNLRETEFHDYWSNVHGPKAEAWMAKWGVLSYIQVGPGCCVNIYVALSDSRRSIILRLKIKPRWHHSGCRLLNGMARLKF
jgi:hypothetical protein